MGMTTDELYFKPRLQVINDEQKAFVDAFVPLMDELSNFSDKELKGWISQDDNFLNDKLEENGFRRWFPKLEDPMWGLLAILHVILKWIDKPKEETTSFMCGEKREYGYKGLSFNKGFTVYGDGKAAEIKMMNVL